MQVLQFPPRITWDTILKRPQIDLIDLEPAVRSIMNDVRQDGDKAVIAYNKKFDAVESSSFLVNESEIVDSESLINEDLKDAIRAAAANIELFHRKQISEPEHVTTMPGVECWRKSIGIEKVGLYIPGGTAPLFSTVLMLGIPAVLAGCKEIVLCTPPPKSGTLHPAILYAAKVAGIRSIFKVGGVQAIAAMTYGTETIPQVYKIFGPGNQYVTLAKQIAQTAGVAIDMPAGPSEVAVFADATAKASFVAADLLSQAEHGIDSQVLLVTTSEQLIDKVQQELDIQMRLLPRMEFAMKSLESSRIILVESDNEAMELLNAYAPEHLILACANPAELANKVVNAGSVFLGHYSPESVGDYASGTNHTLPTNGYARAYSGVSIDSFVKKITFQRVSKEGLLHIGPIVEAMAAAEGLYAHQQAVAVRYER